MREDFVRGAGGDHGAELEGDELVAEAGEERHVVLDDDDRAAGLRLDPSEQRAERFGVLLGDPGGGFVEEDDGGVDGEDAGQLDDAAGAGREVGDRGVGVAAEAEEVDELVGSLVGGGFGVEGGGEGESVGDGVVAGEVPVEGHDDGVARRQRWVEACLLEGAAEASDDAAVRRDVGDVDAADG